MHAGAALLILASLASACTSSSEPPNPVPSDSVVTEFVTQKRLWLPGERQAMIDRVRNNRQLSLPFVGDISDYIDQLLDPDSAVELVPNPALAPAAQAAAVARSPWSATRVPGTGFSTAGLDIRIVDNSQSPPDTSDWLGWFWWSNADSTRVGFVYIAAAGTTVGYTDVDTDDDFDPSEGNTGAGGGEVSAATGEYWQANGWVRRNRARVTVNFAFGGTSAVTSGPFTGGTSQVAIMNGTLDSVRLERVLPGPGADLFASATFTFVGSLRLTCIFPTPCTGP